jgi:hypothetical protein
MTRAANEWTVLVSSGSAGGASGKAVVYLVVEGKAATVEEVREYIERAANGYAAAVDALRIARAALRDSYLRGVEIANREKRGSRAALAGLEMQRYALSGERDAVAGLALAAPSPSRSTVEYRPEVRKWEAQQGGGHVGLYDSEQEARAAIAELNGGEA